MVTAYIDESGNLGRGGEYFVLAAVVFNTKEGDTRIKRIIRKEQKMLSSEQGQNLIPEIKSNRLSFEQRQRILNKIVLKADVDIYYIVFYKRNISLLKHNIEKNLAYNYFASLLADMIFKQYNDDFRIVFDQRSTPVKSMNSLKDYLQIHARTELKILDKDIDISQQDSKSFKNLQAADLVAGSVYNAYTHQNPHFLNIISPRVVKRDQFPRYNFKGSLLL